MLLQTIRVILNLIKQVFYSNFLSLILLYSTTGHSIKEEYDYSCYLSFKNRYVFKGFYRYVLNTPPVSLCSNKLPVSLKVKKGFSTKGRILKYCKVH